MEFVDITTRALNTLSGVITFDLKEDEVLITSDTFEATGHSDSFYAKNKCSFLDVINSSDLNLIQNYGAYGNSFPRGG